MENKRYLAIDFGNRRVGVAVSDPTGLIARPLETLLVTSMDDTVSKIKVLIAEYEPAGIIVGRPLSMSGRENELSHQVAEFLEKLAAITAIPLIYEDERLSSSQAEQVLHSHGMKIKGNKDKIDRIAAAIILQSFLDRRGA